MKFLIFLVALAALILGAIEAPVVDVENVHASNSTVQLGGAQADYKESLQLLFVGDKWNNNFHMLYHCPYGMKRQRFCRAQPPNKLAGYGVDPCVDDPKCERIWIAFHGKSKWAGHSHPPLPKLFVSRSTCELRYEDIGTDFNGQAKKWVPMLGANDCKYENDGSGEAGMLSCGSPTYVSAILR